MTVKITALDVIVPGQVIRKSDGKDTHLTLTEVQARSAFESLQFALGYFDRQNVQGNPQVNVPTEKESK